MGLDWPNPGLFQSTDVRQMPEIDQGCQIEPDWPETRPNLVTQFWIWHRQTDGFYKWFIVKCGNSEINGAEFICRTSVWQGHRN